jgi:oxygen-independent coproporphyrinogen-3 oxidase
VLAFGAGAHGFVGGYTYRNIKNIAHYVDAATNSDLPLAAQRFCEDKELMQRFMVMGLRRLDFELREFDERFGVRWQDIFGTKIRDLVDGDYIALEGTTIRYTDRGLTWANNVRSYFESGEGHVVGYSDTPSIGESGKDHYGKISRVKATDAETA